MHLPVSYTHLHCVNLAQGLKEPVIYYQQHPDREYIDAVKKGLSDIRLLHGQPQGCLLYTSRCV